MKHKGMIYAILCTLGGVLICALYLLTAKIGLSDKSIHFGMAGLLIGAVAWWLIAAKRHPEPEQRRARLLLGILFAGLVLRVGYMLATPASVRGHDLGQASAASGGHGAYLLTLIETHRLPQTFAHQFYQQPLYYLLAAPLSWFVNFLLGRANDPVALVDGAKLVSCFASCGCLLVARRLCDALKLDRRGACIALTVTTFLPEFYLLAGRVGPDALTVFWMLLAFYQTCLWVEKQSWGRTIALAITFGCALCTKVSCGVIALFTAVCMIVIFGREFRAGRAKAMIGKLAVFGVVSVPLGMWYSLRNLFRFGQPLGYVVEIVKTSELYRGNVSKLRVFVPYWRELIASPYADPWKDNSYPVYVVKSALFGEFTYDVPLWLPRVLLAVNIFLVLAAIGAAVWLLIRCKNHNRGLLLSVGVPALWTLLYGSSVLFNLSYPYGCTMDFRYVVPTGVLGGICLGALYARLCPADGEKRSVAGNCLRWGIASACIVYAGFSAVMFCII